MTHPGRAERLTSLNESIGKEAAKVTVPVLLEPSSDGRIGGNGALQHADKPQCLGPLCRRTVVGYSHKRYCSLACQMRAFRWRHGLSNRKTVKCCLDGCRHRFQQKHKNHTFCCKRHAWRGRQRIAFKGTFFKVRIPLSINDVLGQKAIQVEE